MWDKTYKWESDNSNHQQLWDADSQANRDLLYRADDILQTDPSAAVELYRQAADAGSAWAMMDVAGFYKRGTGSEANSELALEYYYRAVCAGSWLATLGYARLLKERGNFDTAQQVLEDGVRLGFIPACYWLARYRYQRSPDRETRLAVLPLMLRAADAGHPYARMIVGRWMIRGMVGCRHIPRGFRMAYQFIRQLRP